MPVSLRPKGKATLIAYEIKGKPDTGKKKKKPKKQEEKLVWEEVRRV